jgi:ArsR family transcriptional regulator
MIMMIDADILIQALSDRTRLRALVLLRNEGALCVCELMAALNVSQPKMSRHLAAMRALDVVEDCRVANRVFYRIDPNLPDWARGAIDHLAESVTASPEFGGIAERLRKMPNRPPQRADFDGGDAEAEPTIQEVDHVV